MKKGKIYFQTFIVVVGLGTSIIFIAIDCFVVMGLSLALIALVLFTLEILTFLAITHLILITHQSS